MKNFIEAAQYAFAALGGALGAVMGGFDGFLYALVVFVVVDYITGLMAAAVEKKLSSEVGFKGIFKKVIIFSLVAVGHIVDTSDFRRIAWYSPSLLTMPFMTLCMRVSMSWYNAESFSNPIPPLCGVVAYLCFGGIASGKRKKPENHLVASDIF